MKRLIPLLMTTWVWAGVAVAQTEVVLQPGAELAIDGTSTVRDFTCKALEVKARLTPGATGSLEPERLTGALSGVRLEIPVARLDCANGTMNEHMFNALLVRQHPTIHFQMSGYEVGTPRNDGQVPLRIRGQLTMAGTTRPVELWASATLTEDGDLRVWGRYPLRMTDWGVRPPTLMLGSLKVGDAVVIRFDLELARR
jgi:polyisoprenoid-binding protein YceI